MGVRPADERGASGGLMNPQVHVGRDLRVYLATRGADTTVSTADIARPLAEHGGDPQARHAL
jgi:hypothetical protein